MILPGQICLSINGSAHKMKKGTKTVILGIAVVAAVATGIFVWPCFNAMRTFYVEEQIHGTFFSLRSAIDKYTETNGRPPSSLNQLIPAFLAAIPTSKYAYKTEYVVVDTSNWVLNVHSQALKPERVYSWRTDWRFTEDERSRLLKVFHDIAVFREKVRSP
jgi:hypothetical protein